MLPSKNSFDNNLKALRSVGSHRSSRNIGFTGHAISSRLVTGALVVLVACNPLACSETSTATEAGLAVDTILDSSTLDSNADAGAAKDSRRLDLAEPSEASRDVATVDTETSPDRAPPIDAESSPDRAPPTDAVLDSGCGDADHDGVCDGIDQCPGEDDGIDIDGNQIADCAENLITNGQFATNVDGWSDNPSSAEVVWSGTDAQGSAFSGSLHLTNRSTSTLTNVVGVYHCVSVTASTQYEFFTQFFIPPGQAVDGQASAQVSFYQTADCSGPWSASYSSPSWGTTAGVWTLGTLLVLTQADTKSVRFRINATKPGSSGDFFLHYDNILLRQ